MKNWPKCDKLPNLVTLALVILTKIKPDMSKKSSYIFSSRIPLHGTKTRFHWKNVKRNDFDLNTKSSRRKRRRRLLNWTTRIRHILLSHRRLQQKAFDAFNHIIRCRTSRQKVITGPESELGSDWVNCVKKGGQIFARKHCIRWSCSVHRQLLFTTRLSAKNYSLQFNCLQLDKVDLCLT